MQIDEVRKSKPKKKKQKRKYSSSDAAPNSKITSDTCKEPKRKKKLIKQPDDRFQISKSEAIEEPEVSASTIGDKKKESNRQRKRKKYQKLLAEKKTQTDILSQQRALNYLSQWKHNREGWKFEKLRQVWLQQNLFCTATIPDKYWETALEYFSNSKGQSRQSLIQEAMKIIENAEKEVEKKQEEESEDTEVNTEDNSKLDRARKLLQYLQE